MHRGSGSERRGEEKGTKGGGSNRRREEKGMEGGSSTLVIFAPRAHAPLTPA